MAGSQSNVDAKAAVHKPKTLWARVAAGQWYAIPLAMEESFRRAGAEICQAAELPK